MHEDEMNDPNEAYVGKICTALLEYSSKMTPDSWKLHLGSDMKVDSEQGDIEDCDQLGIVYHPRVQDCPWLAHFDTISRAQMVEVERIQRFTDVCYYRTLQNPRKSVVFKYAFVIQNFHNLWDELQIWASIPRHPSIPPVDKIVVEGEDELRILGFTIFLVHGGNMQEFPRSLIKFSWLQQLIQAVDDLNLEYGVWHRDIAPRNLLVGDDDAIKLIDFNFALRFGERFGDRRQTHRGKFIWE
ncbi:hypothetical protein ANO11243_080520 [Dothideomycetidae sp. 11243]|nr:hypothetical protein ANO11243_080520 [fungal sp. No.11243]